MPLIKFRTNLTSLKYGMDEPGGGNSGLPYIQFPIPGPNTPNKYLDYYNSNLTSLDYPIRGGAATSSPNGTYSTNAAIYDSKLINAFLQSAPLGSTFINKQKGLQLTNPLTQVPNSLQVNVNNLSLSALINNIFNGNLASSVLPITQAYNSQNTLAQVAAMGTGTFFNRHGSSPTINETIQDTYEYIAGAPANNTQTTNRLAILQALKLNIDANFTTGPVDISNFNIDPDLVNSLGISTIQNQLFNYSGGPGSVYGIGDTIIYRAVNPDGSLVSTDAANATPPPSFTDGGVAQPYSAVGFTYSQLASQATTNYPVQRPVQDFRNQLPSGSTARSNYSTYNIQTRLNVGNPGAPSTRVNYNDTGSGLLAGVGVDKLNALDYFSVTLPNDPWSVEGSNTNDIIKFAFEALDNNNVEHVTALVFRAFLEGQISDSNTGQYNSFKYLGRGETFRTYQGFDRTIGFSFKIYAQSRQEMLPLYSKLNFLISLVYPDYSPTSNLMRGNVVRLTIGQYVYRMPGFLESVNVTIDNNNTSWEICLNEFDDSDVRQLPHVLTVQCSFKPIMDILPRAVAPTIQTAGYSISYVNPFVPLIANGDNWLNKAAKTSDAKKALIFPSATTPTSNLSGVDYDGSIQNNPNSSTAYNNSVA